MTIICQADLVEYSSRDMYNLVNDISQYPYFLPMCQEVEVHMHTEINKEATLRIAKGAVKINLRTYNDMVPGKEIKIRLVKGPFRYLSGSWIFNSINENSCRVILNLEFEFSSKIASIVLGTIFSSVSNTMLDTFLHRADSIYGNKIR